MGPLNTFPLTEIAVVRQWATTRVGSLLLTGLLGRWRAFHSSPRNVLEEENFLPSQGLLSLSGSGHHASLHAKARTCISSKAE